jgi:chromosome segregation ATPase
LFYLLSLREFDKKSKLNEKIKKKFEDFEKEDIHVREGIKHAQEQIKKLKKNIDSESEKLKKYENIPVENPIKIAEAEGKVKELEAERDSLNKQIEKLMDRVNEETTVCEK